MSHTHRQFADALVHALGITPASLTACRRALAVPFIFESSDGNNGWNNPLAITTPWLPGAIAYNTFGDNQHVWRYATFADGVKATATLLTQPHWDGVRHALRASTSRGPILDAFTRAYSWVDWPNASFDGFRRAPFNSLEPILTRLNHALFSPNDPGSL